MASLLRNAAAAVNNKGMPSSFYSNNGKNKPNPVLQSLDKEIKQFMGFIRKKNGKDYQKPDEEAQSRSADTLFEIWNKYEPRLPKAYYQEKVLELGDFLMSAKEYSLALWQCYDRYLMNFGDINVIQITDVETFRSIFFPQGFGSDSAGLTVFNFDESFKFFCSEDGLRIFRALMGKSISMYQVVKVADPKLQNTQNVQNCVQILSFLRLVTQVILPIEKLCWLVYNGTIHIYSISRYMMSLGHSAKVLEYLLWACMCMETSVPLLTVRYLSWRATLYTAVCQCYFDCKATEEGESFARRGLSKIQELSQLESMSEATDSPDREAAFRNATIKMAIMVFKRSVYETRRRPKGLLRPKTRANLKDAQGMVWPRTPSEKLLNDMFEGSAAQLLCVLEALNDTNRRILITSPPAPESDVEILDVCAELFMAAQEIVAGGGGHKGSLQKAPSVVGVTALAGIVPDKTLMQMAAKGEDGATIEAAIKLTKWAFCFEQWEVFEMMNDNVQMYLGIVHVNQFLWDEKCLQILGAMEKVMSNKKHRRTVSQNEDETVDHEMAPSVIAQSTRSVNMNDELIILTDTLMSVVTGPFSPETIEVDIIVDAALFLWNKCKAVFQKYQTGSVDNPKYLSRMENPTKWVYILDVVHQLLCWCGISSVDPALTAEVVLRLGLVLESSAHLDQIEGKKLFLDWGRPSKTKSLSSSTTEEEDSIVKPVSNTKAKPVTDKKVKLVTDTKTDTKVKPVSETKVKIVTDTKAKPVKDTKAKPVSETKVKIVTDTKVKPVSETKVKIVTDTKVKPVSETKVKIVTDTKAKPVTDTKVKPVSDSKIKRVTMPETQERRNRDLKSPLKDTSMSDLGALQDGSQHVSRTSMLSSSLLNVNPRNQLLQARDILELGLKNVSFARQAVALADGKTIADVSWAKELNKELFAPETRDERDTTDADGTVNLDELLPENLRGTATAVWNTVKDLHLELTLMYHRVCLKLEGMGADPSANLPKPFKRRTCSRMQFGSDRSMVDSYVETSDELLARANKNNLSKALLYMQKAYLIHNEGKVTKEQKKLLENAVTCIEKAQTEEKRTYLDNTGEKSETTSRTPPIPILLSRTDHSMVFKPAPWRPSTGEKVAWYRIFARNASGSNVKARLNDYFFPGTGQQVPYHNTELKVSGLKANERYVFAISAYTVDGKLIGDCIGESTRPILANHPLPVLTTWAFLSQLSYQIGCYEICHKACDVLWDHFIAERPPPGGATYNTSNEQDFKLTLMRLNQKVVCLSSPVILRLFLTSIFVSVDINVREGKIFCDSLCDRGPLYPGQLKRLTECEKVLVAIELAGWLNESNLALQAVVQCYGLLAPLIFNKIPSVPVFQILQRCHAVLQEIPSGLRQKRPASIADSLHHMTACVTFHMAKVLRNWGQKTLANNLNDAGRKLLSAETIVDVKDGKDGDKSVNMDTTADNNDDAGSINLQVLKNKAVKKKKPTSIMKEMEAEGPMNEELKALEAHMLSISKQACIWSSSDPQSEHELSGNEDPSILHAYIAYLPSRIAWREVAKFKKRARYLEFFVQVAQKALTEGLPELALEWCEETESWIARRNEQIVGVRAFLTKQPGGTMTVTGDDPKKFAAAMVEYSKEKPGSRMSRAGQSTTMVKGAHPKITGSKMAGISEDKHVKSPRKKSATVAAEDTSAASKQGTKFKKAAQKAVEEVVNKKTRDSEYNSPRAGGAGSKVAPAKGPAKPGKKKQKYKALLVTPSMSDNARIAQEEAEIKALEKFSGHLPDIYRGWHRKKRLRKICNDEMPWKCQLNIVQGLAMFNAFLQKLEKKEKVVGNMGSNMYKTNFMDHEWFTLETAGVLIVGWEGGPMHHINTVASKKHEKKDHRRPSTKQDLNDSFLSSEDDILSALGKGKITKNEFLDLAGMDRPKTTTTGIEIAAALATGVAPPPMFTEPPVIEDTPRTYRSEPSTNFGHHHRNQDQQPDKALLTAQETLDAINRSFNYFKKAIVLAHRGQYWTLLQNSARALWNSIHTALLRAYTPAVLEEDTGLLTLDEIRTLSWRPLYVAADCLLDMMCQLQLDMQAQTAKAKLKGRRQGDQFDSWTGSVLNEQGGASLKFEDPTDDQSVLDVRFIRRLVMRSLELLYYEKKYEKLVDIALRFNALTNDRHAEQIIPLLVQSQRKLTDGIAELGGRSAPQPHYQKLMVKLNSVITAKLYLTQQLELAIDKTHLPPVPPGAAIDPLGHGLYTSKDALKNVSVPLDVPYSLSVLYEAFDKSQYTSRALQHSRKLMILYLSNQQNVSDVSMSRQPSRVDFIPNTARPQPTMPPDLSREEYSDPSDVQTAPIPRSQIGTVVTSYEKTIEMLLAKNANELAAQAMHEIGNLQYHAGNLRAAYKWWADAIDLIMSHDDVLHTWRDLFKDATDISTDLLKRCGIWGCLLAGILASNIAQFILTSDLGLRTECCFLSGYLFKALFRASLPHPQADRDYAMYEVGEGCEVTNLIPGVDLLSEKYRTDGRQLIAALRWVIEELARGHHNMFVLPLLTLNQFFALFMCRDLQRTVDGRILKVRVLSDLGLFTEALQTLQRLLHGERLPHTGDSSFRQVESRVMPIRFDTSKPITEPCNLKVMENVLDKRLSSNLGMLYGPHMTCHLSLVQAHLFICMAHTIPVLPNIVDVVIPEGGTSMRQQTISTVSKPTVDYMAKPHKKKHGDGEIDTITEASNEKGGNSSELPPADDNDSAGDSKSRSTGSGEKSHDDSDRTMPLPKRFTGAVKPINMELVKGTLLVIAEQMVVTIADVIQETSELEGGNMSDLSAAELELVVLCKLEQSEIARQKHHAPMAARIVLYTLKILRASKLFKKRKHIPHPPRPSSLKGASNPHKKNVIPIKLSEPENSQFQYQNFQSRSRLDARLWLACRAALVKSLMMEARGMGDVKVGHRGRSDDKVIQELADCRQYCVEGLNEAESCGDIEKQAEFLVQCANLNIMEGKGLKNTITLLQETITMLNGLACLSIPGTQMLALATVMKTDMEAIEHEDDTLLFTERTMDAYLHAQQILLKQLEEFGEKIEHYYPEGKLLHFSTPQSPLRNIYLPQLLRLVQIKLRIGHAMARNVAKNIKNALTALTKNTVNGFDKWAEMEPVSMWSDALGVLKTGLKLSQVCANREAYLEAELLLNIGKIERMLVYLGKYQARYAVQSLIQAIKISHTTEHNLGLMRQAYLEIAMIYLFSCGGVGGIGLKESSTMDLSGISAVSGTESGEDTGRDSKASIATGRDSKTSNKWKGKKKTKLVVEDTEQEKERKAAWLAIRCAAAVANAQRNRLLLIGNSGVTSVYLSKKAQDDLPEFMALDLVASYVLGDKKKVYKNEIEEELAPLIQAQEIKHTETYEEQLQKAKEAANDLSWIQFLGYQTILQRLCSTATISVSSSSSSSSPATPDNDTDRDLGPEFDLGFISHAECDTASNHDVVRSMLFCGSWTLRLNNIHTYLCENLKTYSSDCCAIYPPEQLELALPSEPATELSLIYKSYESNLTNPSDLENETHLNIKVVLGKDNIPVPPGTQKEQCRPSDKSVVSSTENEVTLQWYQPSIEEADPTKPEASAPDGRVLLMYALNVKSTNTVNVNTRSAWIQMSQLNDLHDRLAVLMQRAEVYLPKQPLTTKTSTTKTESKTASPTPIKAAKSKHKIKSLSAKAHKTDETVETPPPSPPPKPEIPKTVLLILNLLRQCIDDITNILDSTAEPDTSSSGDLPFEASRLNINALEAFFDPSFGATAKGTDLVQWLLKLFPYM